ncbi:hypothetical protein C2S52_015938 [Perilla frutescens var. hirtella]|nr:hypothetical protein C2S52_015938 [Perilla frutescens var. hirtella]
MVPSEWWVMYGHSSPTMTFHLLYLNPIDHHFVILLDCTNSPVVRDLDHIIDEPLRNGYVFYTKKDLYVLSDFGTWSTKLSLKYLVLAEVAWSTSANVILVALLSCVHLGDEVIGLFTNSTCNIRAISIWALLVQEMFELRTCECREFQDDLMPCSHASAAICRNQGMSVYDFVSVYYKTENWKELYAIQVNPIPLEEDWNVPSETSLGQDGHQPPQEHLVVSPVLKRDAAYAARLHT